LFFKWSNDALPFLDSLPKIAPDSPTDVANSIHLLNDDSFSITLHTGDGVICICEFPWLGVDGEIDIIDSLFLVGVVE